MEELLTDNLSGLERSPLELLGPDRKSFEEGKDISYRIVVRQKENLERNSPRREVRIIVACIPIFFLSSNSGSEDQAKKVTTSLAI